MNRLANVALLCICLISCAFGQEKPAGREKLLLDDDWKFAFGHPSDPVKDFGFATSYFSYLAKAGYGDGPADPAFDDRPWRQLQLPHDWAAEQDVDPAGSFSHGFKKIGRAFPERSIGWYRKTFPIPAADKGRRIAILFDGVFRNAQVFINGHYLGTEPSGYLSFEYDITDYLEYGGENVITVRADATMEEGWFYEGAGIYRHVWLQKYAPLHLEQNGLVVTTAVQPRQAVVQVGLAIRNQHTIPQTYTLKTRLYNAAGALVQQKKIAAAKVGALAAAQQQVTLQVPQPRLWSPDAPYLYTLETIVETNGKETDKLSTAVGIRTICFDAREGLFINNKPVKLKGTNNHQDHAGVGVAVPDALLEYRLKALKQMGVNAYRCSHHPPAPELLDLCDKLGILVIDENRLMGTTGQPMSELKRMLIRDRNHPSVFCWSIGNEEWRIENNQIGATIAQTMQAYVKSIDSTRPVTAGISGGFRSGISNVLEVMGYNYMGNGDIEAHHRQFPQQPAMGTEEGSTFSTRGIYTTDTAQQHIAAYDKKPRPSFYSIEEGWNFYADRPYLAGLFIWTGFDYRGEPTPYGWPSVNSYFGMMDICGFPKDNYYYLKSWWRDTPVIHLLPHWNRQGQEGKPTDVWVYSNCEEVELLLNGVSKGRKTMKRNGHLEWQLPYQPGMLQAVGYNKGQQTITETIHTSGKPTRLALEAHNSQLKADGRDIAVLTVSATDNNGYPVPDAANEVVFTITGPGKIIGVGNGNPSSREKEQFIEELINLPLKTEARTENKQDTSYRFQGSFELPGSFTGDSVVFFYKSIGVTQTIRINNQVVATELPQQLKGNRFSIQRQLLKPGSNTVVITGRAIVKKNDWDVVNTDPGIIQLVVPANPWQRKLFSGKAQVIVQSTGGTGSIQLQAASPGLQNITLHISAR